MARAALLLAVLLAGCAAQPTGTDQVLDPTAARADMGTLVDVSDVLEVSQKMVSSLRASPQVAALLKERRPLRIVLEPAEIKNLTSMTTFNKRLFVNELITLLGKAAGEDFQFIDREAVAAERARQLAAAVQTSGVEAQAAGADLVLSGRILEKLDQRAAPAGGVQETRSVQFSFSLVQVKDAVTLWTDSYFRVKQQTIGTVYG